MGNERQKNIRVLLGLPRHEREAAYVEEGDAAVYQPPPPVTETEAEVEKRATAHWRLVGAIIMVLALIGLVRSMMDLSRARQAEAQLVDVPPCR